MIRAFLDIELKNIFRNIAFRVGFLMVFLFGVYGIYYGDSIIRSQKENIAKIGNLENENIEHILQIAKREHTADTQLYYMIFHTYNSPNEWSALAIGQKDVLNYNIKFKILAIEGQIYDTELTNPLALLVGNLDLSFVFIYLFPLLIIALGFNLISEEKEIGVWDMVKTSGVSVLSFVAYKIVIRWGLVVMLAILLLVISGWVFGASFDLLFLSILLVTIGYISFWFSLVWIVVSLNKNSSFNAIMMICIWMIFCIVLPALGNIIINTTIPVHKAMETALVQREAYHEKWDMSKSITMEKFYREYPEYKKYKISEDKYYIAGWYFAMQYVADKESESVSQEMENKLIERQNKAEHWGMFLPTVGTQRIYNAIAHADLASHLEYLKSVRRYHKELREYFYPYIFNETLTMNVPWDKRPKYIPIEKIVEIEWKSFFVSIFISLMLIFIGIRKIRKI